MKTSRIFHRTIRRFINSVEERDRRLKLENDDPYSWEFLQIRLESDDLRNISDYSCDVGIQPENMRKNRYRDILPFDHTRVKIASDSNDSTKSDYINASLIVGANNSIGYIATQGPMLETLGDFWRMVFDFGVKTILMLCDLYEGAKPKCHQYWPEVGSSVEYGNITIANTFEVQPQNHYTVRHLTLTSCDKVTKIQQFHYHGWPDHGTPDEIEPLLEYLEAFRAWQQENDLEPVVVHCSAGCGRSGTVCALDIVRTHLNNGTLPEDFTVSSLVSELRRQRIAMVQSKEQYVLLYHAISQMFSKHLFILEDSLEGNEETDCKLKAMPSMENGCPLTLHARNRIDALASTSSLLASDVVETPSPNSTTHVAGAACSKSKAAQMSNDGDGEGLTKNASSSSVFTHDATPPFPDEQRRPEKEEIAVEDGDDAAQSILDDTITDHISDCKSVSFTHGTKEEHSESTSSSQVDSPITSEKLTSIDFDHVENSDPKSPVADFLS